MNNFTPRAQQVLALARKGSRSVQSQLCWNRAPAARADQARAGRRCQRASENGTRPGDSPDGSREASRLRAGDQNGRQHSLHAAREEGARPGGQGSKGLAAFLRGHWSIFCWACSAKARALPLVCSRAWRSTSSAPAMKFLRNSIPTLRPQEAERRRSGARRERKEGFEDAGPARVRA